MRRWILCLFLITFVFISYASTVKIDDSKTSITVISSSDTGMRLEFRFGAFNANSVEINGSTYQQLKIDGEPATYQKGEPELPFFARSIIIPCQSGVKATLVESDAKEYPYQPVPSKGTLSRTIDPEQVPWTFSATYTNGASYPAISVETSEPYILREFRGTVIKVYPFVYNAKSKTLTVRHRMVVEISFEGNSDVNTLSQNPTTYSRDFEEIYTNHFLNFNSSRYTALGETGKILVICYHDFLEEIQPYVDWKIQKGIQTQLVDVSTLGAPATAAQIKAYIQTQYNLGDLAFVQLVGDATQIPSFEVYYQGYGGSDPTYSLLAGTDNYPDIYVGRFSAETEEQVITQVNKTIYYERDMVSPNWYNKATGIASEYGTGDDNEYDYQHMNNLRTQLLGYNFTLVDQIYGINGGTAAMVTAAVNDGRSIMNYCGHGNTTSWGTTGFSSTHVDALTNYDKFPIIFSVACLNGNFVSNTCFAESWLRAKNVPTGNTTGAVAFYGSSVNQDWSSPMQAQDEFARLLTTNSKHTVGGLMYNSSCSMMDAYGSVGATMFKTWHIFGDASLNIYSAPPSVTTNFQINRNGSNIILTWNASSGAVSYKIYRTRYQDLPNWGAPYATTTQTTWMDNIGASNHYYYRVTASTTP